MWAEGNRVSDIAKRRIKMTKVSVLFRVRLKLAVVPQYKICQAARVNPSQLSKLLHGIDPVRPNDSRVVAVGKVLGLQPSQCFEETKELTS